MKHILLHIILCCLLALFFTGCQDRKGTAPILKEAEALMYTRPDFALQILEAIPQPEQLIGQEQADYALLLSLARYRSYISVTSDSLISIAIKYYRETDDADKCAKAWYTYGGIMDEIGEMDTDSIIYAYKEAEKHIPQMKDSTMLALIYSNLAYLNKKSLQYELAKTYYQKAEHINRLSANHRQQASNYLNLYGLYSVLGKKDSAAWCVERMLQLCPLLTDSAFLAKVYHNIGVWHKYQANPIEAQRCYIRSLQYTPSAPSYKTLTALADLYGQDKADSLYQQALAQADMNTRTYIYRQLYKKSIKEQNLQKATIYAENYIAASDSFYKAQLNNKILEAQLKYDQLALQHENTSLEKNLYLSILIAFIILFVTGLFIRYYRIKQKEMISITHILQQQIDDLKSEMNQYNELEKVMLQKKIDQLEKLKYIYTTQGYLDLPEIKAAGTMKTIVKELKYVPKNDRVHLIHWLNIYRNGFAARLERAYPQLTQERQLDVCYLSAAGFDAKHIARLLNIKERTVERYMTDICKKTQFPEEGKKGFQSLILQLCIHPEIKKDAENIASFTKFS